MILRGNIISHDDNYSVAKHSPFHSNAFGKENVTKQISSHYRVNAYSMYFSYRRFNLIRQSYQYVSPEWSV